MDLNFFKGQHKFAKKWAILGLSLRKKKRRLDKWPHFFHLLFELQLSVIFIFVFEKSQNLSSWRAPFGPFWSAKYLNFGGETCEITILSCLIQETYTLRKLKNQILLFQSS